ncbi:hypothetical protein H310_02688 [Aphanomyces invadans]|uniref:Phosphoribosyltransferase domain-containing protein n=1 Tax=Aphanomyces invadans TaxID=157072 RepID=A0A024UJ43_9STRA|nr:hypothetical protein H310_02688 [Aphanomyces invadans]ETW06431.1 hypothetical protein H310_02688 [Aphanomyces invadans]|eukprot:XP_008864506.1 hypothetical protein H310_02688 [Aphanomyces invadans]
MLRRSTVHIGAAAAAAVLASQKSPGSTARCEKIYESGQVLGRGVKLELWKAKHKNVDVLDLESETIQTGLTHVRDYHATGAKFVHVANKLLRNVLESALTQLPNDEDVVVTTPLGHKIKGIDYEDGVNVCGIALVERDLVLEQMNLLLKTTLPFDSVIGHLQLSANSSTPGALATATLPDGIEDMHVILVHPEFASFDVVQPALQLLLKKGVPEDHIQVVTLVTCPAAADKFCATFADVSLVTAAFDATSDSQGRIVPGLGNFEKRYAGDAIEVPDVSDDQGDGAGTGGITSWWPFK